MEMKTTFKKLGKVNIMKLKNIFNLKIGNDHICIVNLRLA